MASPLTQAALARLAALLAGGNTFGGNTFGGNTFGGRQFGGQQFGASAAPNPPLAPAPPPVTPQELAAPPPNPPMPNPPLAAPPPPVTAASFPPAQPATPPAMPPAIPPAAAPPNVANIPAPVGSDPSMADETVRQTMARILKPKMLPAQWAQNFGSLADQQGG